MAYHTLLSDISRLPVELQERILTLCADRDIIEYLSSIKSLRSKVIGAKCGNKVLHVRTRMNTLPRDKYVILESWSDKECEAKNYISLVSAVVRCKRCEGRLAPSKCIGRTMNLRGMTMLRSLVIESCYGLVSLRGVRHISGLHTLVLRKCRELKDIDDITGLSVLRRLELLDCPSLEEVDKIGQCTSLRVLAIASVNASTEDSLSRLTQLENIEFSSLDVTSLDFGACSQLKRLSISRCRRLRRLQLPAGANLYFEHLTLYYMSELELTPLRSLQKLVHLDISGCSKIGRALRSWADSQTSDFGRLVVLKLKSLEFDRVAFLPTCRKLEELDLSFNGALQTIDGLDCCLNLKILDISYCSRLQSLAPLKACRKLQDIQLLDCYSLTDLNILAHCPSIPCWKWDVLLVLRKSACALTSYFLAHLREQALNSLRKMS